MIEAEASLQNVGPWTRLRILGRGGFGQVTLWHNSNTNQFIAMKNLRENELHNLIKTKQQDRWTKEVEIMGKLQHSNVVTALPIPEELKTLALSSLPVLAMEYCKLGDLRQLLNQPEHCCGLPEASVVSVFKDMSSGLAYLHSCKIIHRDLKPDNIVLQDVGGVVVYKLIDLGYAKELDQNSVCESFVGTIQYLAPELFLSKSYTCSVDYWSLGLVAHEVMTGYRPFLPGFPPAQWMRQIQDKKRSVINVYQKPAPGGEIVHSSQVQPVTQISRCLRRHMEDWLQLALDWNGQTRGRCLDTNQLEIFDNLNTLTSRPIVNVFSVATYEILSYEVTADMSVLTLQGWLSADTNLELDDQVLLATTGKSLAQRTTLMHSLAECPSDKTVSVFLYTGGPMKPRFRAVPKPVYVKELLEDPKKLLEYKHLKRSCSDSVYFVQTTATMYYFLLKAIRAKIENIKQRTAAVQTLLEDVCDEWTQVETYAQFLIIAHKTDLENYIQLRKGGDLASSGSVQKWIQKVNDVETKLSELRTSCNKNQQKMAVEQAKLNLTNLENSVVLQSGHTKVFSDVIDDAHKLWDRVRKIPRDVRGISMSNTDMVKILYRCLEIENKMLKSPLLGLLLTHVGEAEEHVAKLVSPLTIWLKSTKIMKQIILTTQRERQKEIWMLISKTKPAAGVTLEALKKTVPTHLASESVSKPGQLTAEKTPNEEATEKTAQLSPFHVPKTVHNELPSPVDSDVVLRPDFKVMEPVSIVPPCAPRTADPRGSSFVAEDPGTPTSLVIMDNNHLRYRTQDLTLSCHKMMKEIQSLNWDFLSET